MTSSESLAPNYVYVVIRLKMAESVNSLVGTALLVIMGRGMISFPLLIEQMHILERRSHDAVHV